MAVVGAMSNVDWQVAALPPPEDQRLKGLCRLMWGTAVVAGLLGLGRASVAAQGTPGWDFPYDAFMVGGMLLGALAAAAAGVGLRSRRHWAYIVAAVELAVALLALLAGVIGAVIAPTEPRAADGPGYLVMGGAMVGTGLVVALGYVLAPASRRALRLPAPGWLPDPAGVHVWRYWDGTHWTGHVA